MNREDVYKLIDGEREYQDKKWSQVEANLPLPPSDELRLIKLIAAQADAAWYVTTDKNINGVKVNPADLEAIRKIAACAVRCMENYDTPPKSLNFESITTSISTPLSKKMPKLMKLQA